MATILFPPHRFCTLGHLFISTPFTTTAYKVPHEYGTLMIEGVLTFLQQHFEVIDLLLKLTEHSIFGVLINVSIIFNTFCSICVP